MDIDKEQINIINKSKKYLKKIYQDGFDVSNSANCYFCSFAYTPGQIILKKFQNNQTMLTKKVDIFLRYIFAISKLSNCEVYNDKDINNFDKIIVSWSTQESFNSDGSYFDKYFHTNSRDNKKILWFLISVDNYHPEELDNNIVVFYSKNKNRKNLFFLIKSIICNIFENKFSIKKSLFSLSYYTLLSKIIYKKFKPIILRNNFSALIMPYEAQPFQNFLFKKVNELKKNIETIGYVHSTQPFPSHNLYREGAPKKLFVHGEDEKFHLINILDWPDNCIKVIPSLRYKKAEKNILTSKIMIPYHISNQDLYIEEIKKILKNKNNKEVKPFIIANHPHMKNSNPHLKFVKKINNLLNIYKDKFSENSKQVENIVLGGSYSVLPLLERGNKVIHVCADPVLESYTKAFWPNISVQKLSDNSFIYHLKKVGSCIKFGQTIDKLEKYIN